MRKLILCSLKKSGMMSKINWERVNRNLYCPQCGEKAHIIPGTDGTEGGHSHSFKITREMAEELSKPNAEERQALKEKAIEMLREIGADPSLITKLAMTKV